MSAKKKDTRPWWKKKSTYGLAILGLGGILSVLPAALALGTISGVSITAAMAAPVVTKVGELILGVGILSRISRRNDGEAYEEEGGE